jgi:FixJ family two-component response regulator
MVQSWSEKLLEKIAISIVDDDESVREGLVSLMQSHGYAAEAFDSASAFLNADRGRSTDCLIADMHMPGMTGLELVDRLAASGQSVPTILITARHDERVRERALKAGVHCYLPKPFKEESLLRCIHAALAARDDGHGP